MKKKEEKKRKQKTTQLHYQEEDNEERGDRGVTRNKMKTEEEKEKQDFQK